MYPPPENHINLCMSRGLSETDKHPNVHNKPAGNISYMGSRYTNDRLGREHGHRGCGGLPFTTALAHPWPTQSSAEALGKLSRSPNPSLVTCRLLVPARPVAIRSQIA